MDLSSIHVENNPLLISPSLYKNGFLSGNPSSCSMVKVGSSGFGDLGNHCMVLKDLRNCSSVNRSVVVRAKGKKNNGNSSSSSSSSSSSGSKDESTPEGDGSEGRNPAPDGNISDDSTTNGSHNTQLDWRTVRANFVAQKKVLVVDPESPVHKGVSEESSKPLGSKWAHPIHVPENGCVLVATEKLDGVRSFERSVVLILKSGNKNPREGPFGIVINRPLHKKVKDMKPTNLDLVTTFADCSLRFGGPLEASMFLLNTGVSSKLPAFEEVLPGLCYGARNSLDRAAEQVKKGMLKSQDFTFFVGYAGWKMDQLKEEIESGYWYLAACSESLIDLQDSSSSEGLWNEILQLMGGQYSELSRKPKQDI